MSKPVAREFDKVVNAAARRIFGWSEAEFGSSVLQAVRRPVDGGVGLLPAARRCPFAYLSRNHLTRQSPQLSTQLN